MKREDGHEVMPDIRIRTTERMCRGNGINLNPAEITGRAPNEGASTVEQPVRRAGERTITDKGRRNN